MFNERRSIERFNAYQCIRSYLIDLSMKELVEFEKDYGIKVAKASSGIKNKRLTLHAVDNIPSQNILVK